MMGQGRGCRQGHPTSPIPVDKCVLLCLLLCWVLHYRLRRKPHDSRALVSYVEPCDDPGKKVRDEEVRQALKNIIRSLGIGIYQDGFLKLIL
ncbi:hypothetical protein AVEN_176277-1, partial [Araneus ventricosus]